MARGEGAAGQRNGVREHRKAGRHGGNTRSTRGTGCAGGAGCFSAGKPAPPCAGRAGTSTCAGRCRLPPVRGGRMGLPAHRDRHGGGYTRAPDFVHKGGQALTHWVGRHRIGKGTRAQGKRRCQRRNSGQARKQQVLMTGRRGLRGEAVGGGGGQARSGRHRGSSTAGCGGGTATATSQGSQGRSQGGSSGTGRGWVGGGSVPVTAAAYCTMLSKGYSVDGVVCYPVWKEVAELTPADIDMGNVPKTACRGVSVGVRMLEKCVATDGGCRSWEAFCEAINFYFLFFITNGSMQSQTQTVL